MNELIDDLLTLARAGRDIDELEPVELEDAVEAAWQGVATDEATLTVETEFTLSADKTRLRQLLGNLIRNAVEHAGPDVTVTVGDTPGGFYVADNGPGVPAEDRERIFESGYTTAEEGTGFGLAIVEEIAEAHGWSIAVAESESGGARFEFTGITRVSPRA
ncbi:MAG: sensor histidine kinase [Halosegnis sp.]